MRRISKRNTLTKAIYLVVSAALRGDRLRHADIHSFDSVAVMLPDGVMLAGDMLEDSITFVTEPARLHIHLAALRDMQAWDIRRILPSHGTQAIIAAGGYGPEFVEATRLYVENLLRLRDEPALAAQDFKTFAAASFDTGGANYSAAYEPVHKSQPFPGRTCRHPHTFQIKKDRSHASISVNIGLLCLGIPTLPEARSMLRLLRVLVGWLVLIGTAQAATTTTTLAVTTNGNPTASVSPGTVVTLTATVAGREFPRKSRPG